MDLGGWSFMSFFGQRLTKLPEFSPDESSTRVLDLNGNNLECLPESIGSLENLEIIFAGGNRLEELPAGIGNLTKLRVLDLDRDLLLWSTSRALEIRPGSLRLLRLEQRSDLYPAVVTCPAPSKRLNPHS